MTRFRDTRGASWRGPQPGTRQWASRSVSYGPGTALAYLIMMGLLWLFVLGPLWIVAECWTVLISAVAVMAGWWITKTIPQYDVRFIPGPCHLWYFTGRP
jgi:hypothetical protein